MTLPRYRCHANGIQPPGASGQRLYIGDLPYCLCCFAGHQFSFCKAHQTAQVKAVLIFTVAMIGSATTPLTMFVIGFQLGGLKLKEVIGDFQVYAICFVKLLIVPVIALLVVKLWVEDFSLLEKVLIMGFAMPVGAVAAIFSQRYKGQVAFATKSVLLSTVLSLLTIPVFAIIMEL